MKRIVICADGSWNDRRDGKAVTNVAKLHRAIDRRAPDGTEQLAYYHAGVGTRPGERVIGGAFGAGIDRNIKDCYRFLVEHYEACDELFFFGFSRGAYTVRSLAGLLRNSGIVERADDIDAAFALYRDRSPETHPSSSRARRFRANHARPVYNGCEEEHRRYRAPDIQVIGVWDTVGALGLPGWRYWLARPILQRFGINWWFHDTSLSGSVVHAYQALAIHERRSLFEPTLWKQQLDDEGRPERIDQRLEQAWFAGVHSDVGGGYCETGLSDLALAWIVGRATERGLSLAPDVFARDNGFQPDPLAPTHESWVGFFKWVDILCGRRDGDMRIPRMSAPFHDTLAQPVVKRAEEVPDATWPTRGHPSFRSLLVPQDATAVEEAEFTPRTMSASSALCPAKR